MTPVAGVDLNGVHSESLYAVGIIVGGLIAFDHSHLHLSAESLGGCLKQ